ncbi:MAG: hypothetical protein L6R42_007457 [Xanthoria sp. 1 TBL-2021]|nr:MAG: hypothetical protein L6R42_007457 [Xanthoria sp. 1 TBL-2021]
MPDCGHCLQETNPYTYTSGHWLHRDREQRDARYIGFDFDQLRKKVIGLYRNANKVTSCHKHEGGFNRVFVFTLDHTQRVVARLPTHVAGPPELTTNSEVATIEYLQSNTAVPIPKILDWSDDRSNPIGSEYIIMEHAKGVQLHQRWPTMDSVQKIQCIKAIGMKIQQIAALNFPAYGSLYSATVKVKFPLNIPLTPGFCIGPCCKTRPNRGPWSDLQAYCDGLVDTGISRIPPQGTSPRTSSELITTHIDLLSYCRQILHKLASDARVIAAAAPTLHHADLNKRNIFVLDDDPTVIADIIDWQSSSIEPAFEYADETPDFAALPEPELLDAEFSDAARDHQPNDETAELCHAAYETCLQGMVPKIAGARHVDKNLLRPFRYSHRTWVDGAVVLRQELNETAARWNELGLPSPCPYPIPTAEALSDHQQEYKDLLAAHKLKRQIMEVLDIPSDGWVPSEAWAATKEMYKQVFETSVHAVNNKDEDDDDLDEEKLRKMWPYDIPNDV